MKKLLTLTLALTLATACAPVQNIDTTDTRQVARMTNVMELEHRDWVATSDMMIDSMLRSGAFARIENPVIAMGPMVNDTMQRFDTNVFMAHIRSYLVNSGRVQMATAFAGEDETAFRARTMRDNIEFDQATIAGTGTMVAPNMSMSGRMIQRNLNVPGGMFARNQVRVEYSLQLTLTDLRTGLSVWEEHRPIIRQGRNAPRW
ncbi:MAG: penicillin-binding protein activator LpoB [Alphaproteobacteria bacterium]|nr:penicillin-binding protein activator LpoB [Alphaproteobacteria bacterium]